jgi:hypothetical protein
MVVSALGQGLLRVVDVLDGVVRVINPVVFVDVQPGLSLGLAKAPSPLDLAPARDAFR